MFLLEDCIGHRIQYEDVDGILLDVMPWSDLDRGIDYILVKVQRTNDGIAKNTDEAVEVRIPEEDVEEKVRIDGQSVRLITHPTSSALGRGPIEYLLVEEIARLRKKKEEW